MFKAIKDWMTGSGIKRNLMEVGMNIHSASSYKVWRMSYEFRVKDRGSFDRIASFMQSKNGLQWNYFFSSINTIKFPTLQRELWEENYHKLKTNFTYSLISDVTFSRRRNTKYIYMFQNTRIVLIYSVQIFFEGLVGRVL